MDNPEPTRFSQEKKNAKKRYGNNIAVGSPVFSQLMSRTTRANSIVAEMSPFVPIIKRF